MMENATAKKERMDFNAKKDDIKRDRDIKKNKRKVDVAIIISLIALITSIIQLIITSPFFIDIYNKPNVVVEEGENISLDSIYVNLNYHIKNESTKTANNLVLAVDLYDLNTISFTPDNAFIISDSIDGDYFFNKRYFFTKRNLIPNEDVGVFIWNYLNTIRKKIGADTLKSNVAYNCQQLVPHIAELKTDLGFAKIIRNDKYIIRACRLTHKGEYKLQGDPIK